MEQLLIDIGTLFRHLFTPEILSVVGTISAIGYKLFQSISKRIKKEQDLMSEGIDLQFDKINKKFKDLSSLIDSQNAETRSLADQHYRDNLKEILRLQILDGIQQGRLSPTEVQFFYDKYHALGGNSFVSAKVKHYIENYVDEKEGEEEDND